MCIPWVTAMSVEAGVIVAWDSHPLYFHTPPGRSAVALPDSVDLWEMFWKHRDELAGFAHSHPGTGLPQPSHTDITTFRAIESALGRRVEWWIISEDTVAYCRWMRRVRSEPGTWIAERSTAVYPWLDKLRRLSYGGA